MTISIWRYSHLALAVSSFLFITLASVTGIVLSAEPVSEKIQPYHSDDFDAISVAQIIPALKQQHAEITDVRIDANDFVIAKIIDTNGKNEEIYIDPKTGKSIAKFEKKSAFFEWVTNLHRSLFLHETGRFLVGLTAFLLLLIAASGTVLVIQRQRGIKRFFTKVVKENFAQYYHVVLGRLSLILILTIALSGTYLSLVRFKMFPEQKISHDIDYESIKSEPKRNVADFPIFKNLKLSDVKSVEFPFSDDPEDYFTVKLHDKEIAVNQYTGEILNCIAYSKTAIFSELSLDLHTGRASAIWAVVLAIAAANILFFIYSGFAIMLKRRANQIRNTFKKSEAEYIILTGSENGSTLRFANIIQSQLLQNGQKSHIAELNDYTVYPKAKHILVIAATYGLGNPPSNASKFLKLIQQFPQQHKVFYSVVGFGSHAYPDFCRFAFDADQAFSRQEWSVAFLEMHTVNDRSPEDFIKWAELWSQKSGILFSIPTVQLSVKQQKLQVFSVTEKTKIAHEDGAFLIELKSDNNIKFKSGDLLAIYPENDHRERQYSIGKINNNIQLSVKLHQNGLGSGYLYHLHPGDKIDAKIIKNPHFYFPKKAESVVMVSNGTGIAPFLGMIEQNRKNTDCYLYCGFRGKDSYELYRKSIQTNLDNKKLQQLNLAYSREGERQYVKDLLSRDALFIVKTLKNGGVIMICGSLAMQQNVYELLENICLKYNGKSLSFYQSRNQLLADCY